MSGLNLSVGIVVVAGLGQLALSLALPDPKPIEVHSLEYRAGQVVQERTVTTKGPVFWAKWSASIIDAQTGRPVLECTGSGEWKYTKGHGTFSMSLARWTGNDACTEEVLRGGRYFPRAAWIWGDDQTTKDGPVFEVK